MPQIPEFTAEPVNAPGISARADPSALAAPGRATQQVGQHLEQIGDALGKLQQFHDYQYVADNWADATTAAHDRLQNGIETARQSDYQPGFAKAQRQALDQDLQSRIDNAPSASAAAHLKRHFATLTDAISGKAASFEHGMAVDDAVAKTQTDIGNAATRNLRDPTLLDDDIANIKGRIAGYGSQGVFNQEQRVKLEKAAGASIGSAHLIARAEADPIGTMADLKAGKYDDIIDAKTLETLQPRLQTSIAKGVNARLGPPQLGGDTDAGGNWEVAHNNFAGMRIPGVNAGPKAGGFQSFATPEEGVKAIEHQLERYYQGATTGKPITTLRGIISTWAPPSENDTPALIARAAQVTGFDPDAPLTFDPPTRAKLIEAMIRNEQGGKLPVDPAVIAKVAGAPPPSTAADSGKAGGLAGVFQRIDALGLDPEIAAKIKTQQQATYSALETDQLRQQRMQTKAEQDRSHAAEDAIIRDSRSDNPQLSARDVANNDALTPEAKMRMIAFLAKDGVVDPGRSHQTAIGLMKGIAAGDITDRAPLITAYGKGDLGQNDFNFLDKQLADARTPDGERLAKRKSEFLKGVEPQIDKSAFAGVPDVQGKERYYDFQYQLDQKIDEYRKAGKNPNDLLDPSKPDYLGKPEALKPYRRDLAQLLSDLPAGGPITAPDLSSKDGIVTAYKAGKLTRAEAERALIAGGFAATPVPVAPPAPTAPIAR